MLARVLAALAIVAALTAFAPAPFPKPGRKPSHGRGLAALQWTWSVSRSRAGDKDGVIRSPFRQKVKIQGNRWSFLREIDGTWQASGITYQITLDDKHNPPHIDLSRTTATRARPGSNSRALAAK